VNEQTLRNWVNDYRKAHAADEPPLTVSERARLRELEREVRELRLEKEFLAQSANQQNKRRPADRARLANSRFKPSPVCAILR
jgi:transposase-like protein